MSGERKDHEHFSVKSPVTGEEVGLYESMDAAMVDDAVNLARVKSREWAEVPPKNRAKVLLKAASILAGDPERFARVVSAETGKTMVDAFLADVYPVCDLLHHYGKHLSRYLKPVKVNAPRLLPGRRAFYSFEPKGVVGVISPWNYPFTLAAGPSISALAAGNAVVLKPASQTTGSGKLVEDLLLEAGLPHDVFQVVTGSGSVTGQALIEHPGVDMLFFTGSTEVGREVNIQAARRLIPAVMELGGKDVAIVTARADIKRAAHGVIWGAFTNNGQTCIGTEVCLVEKSVYREFLDELLPLARRLKNGRGPGEIGPMTLDSQLDIVRDQLADALAKGAEILAGGKWNESMGLYFPPTVLGNVTAEMKVMSEETFGPLLPIMSYESEDQAIALANRTLYGLSGAVYTGDREEGRRLAARMQTGSVCINDCLIAFAVPGLPFGGVKESGLGRYHGRIGLHAFCNIKSVTEFGWKLGREPYHYPMAEGIEGYIKSALNGFFSRNPIRRLVGLARVSRATASFMKHNRDGDQP